MKIILCTGDSHTWGQGAKNVLEEFAPPAMAGDLRLLSFRPKSYVNLLRRYVERATSSASYEWSAQELAAVTGAEYVAPCALIGDKYLNLTFRGSLLRIEHRLVGEPYEWEVTVDGKVEARESIPAVNGENCYRLLNIHLDGGEHTLNVRAVSGVLPLFRIESYDGEWAVVNGGIGSCTTDHLAGEFFGDHVADVRPDVVLAEAHTINDWLNTTSTDQYAEHLEALIRAYEKLGARTVLMTVSPVEGAQRWNGGPLYGDYIEVSRQVARKLGIPLCDAHRVMSEQIFGMNEKDTNDYLFDDPWHPNERGHAIYAEMLAGSLEAIIGKKIDVCE